jgi:hypothetical protein
VYSAYHFLTIAPQVRRPRDTTTSGLLPEGGNPFVLETSLGSTLPGMAVLATVRREGVASNRVFPRPSTLPPSQTWESVETPHADGASTSPAPAGDVVVALSRAARDGIPSPRSRGGPRPRLLHHPRVSNSCGWAVEVRVEVSSSSALRRDLSGYMLLKATNPSRTNHVGVSRPPVGIRGRLVATPPQGLSPVASRPLSAA